VSDRGVAKELLTEIQQRCNLSQAPSGKELEQHFKEPPFGWPLEVVQLTLAILLRDGQDHPPLRRAAGALCPDP